MQCNCAKIIYIYIREQERLSHREDGERERKRERENNGELNYFFGVGWGGVGWIGA